MPKIGAKPGKPMLSGRFAVSKQSRKFLNYVKFYIIGKLFSKK